MGSPRFGTLGEATINLISYMNLGSSIQVSLPLKKCNHGAILQVKIQCLTSRTRLRLQKEEALQVRVNKASELVCVGLKDVPPVQHSPPTQISSAASHHQRSL